MSIWLQAVVVFLSVTAADFAWTKYNLHVTGRRAHLAGMWSATIIAFGSVSVISYTANHWLLIPALAGAYVGTYIAVSREHR